MILTEYILTTKNVKSGIIFRYNTDGLLQEIIFNKGVTAEQLAWWKTFLPATVKELKAVCDKIHKSGNKPLLKAVEPDLTFTKFWNTYGNKVGKKATTENIWKTMPVQEKIKAYNYILRYKSRLAQTPGITQMYPSTYLNRAEWNN